MLKQAWDKHVRIHLLRDFSHTLFHRPLHDHLPDCQVPQEESTCQNDAHNADHSQHFLYNRFDF